MPGAPGSLGALSAGALGALRAACVKYTLEVAQDGTGFLHVESGWVAFEVNGRESFVPAGALAITRPGLGPGTPYFEDAAPEFHRAVAELDTLPAGEPRRSTALDSVLSLSRRRDALTVWHLLGRLAGDEQARAYTRMAALVPPPDRVTRAGILSGDRAMLDAWWNALGLDDASWWRVWKGPVPSR